MWRQTAFMVRLLLDLLGSDSSATLFARCLFTATQCITLVDFDRPLFEEASREVAAFSPVNCCETTERADKRGKRKHRKANKGPFSKAAAAGKWCEGEGGKAAESAFRKFKKKDDGKAVAGRRGGLDPQAWWMRTATCTELCKVLIDDGTRESDADLGCKNQRRSLWKLNAMKIVSDWWGSWKSGKHNDELISLITLRLIWKYFIGT